MKKIILAALLALPSSSYAAITTEDKLIKTFHFEEFLVSGTWVRPSGVSHVYLTMIGGGGGGSSGNDGGGGGGGEIVYRLWHRVTGNATVTIGAGGVADTAGGNTIFDTGVTSVTVAGGGSTATNQIGGDGGTSALNDSTGQGGVAGVPGSTGTVFGLRWTGAGGGGDGAAGGTSIFSRGGTSDGGGGGGGAGIGQGARGGLDGAVENPPPAATANTGAGGGGADGANTGGTGGSGYVLVEWWE